MIALTSEQLSERRRERVEILARLAEMGPLKRRLKTIEAELLAGCAIPAKGVRPEQTELPLAVAEQVKEEASLLPLRDRVLALLERSKRRRSARVLAALLDATPAAAQVELERLHDEKRVQRWTTQGGFAYQLTEVWKATQGRKRQATKPAKARTAARPTGKDAADAATTTTPAKPRRQPKGPQPTKTVRELKPVLLDGYSPAQWSEAIDSVCELLGRRGGAARGAWLLLNASPSSSAAAEVVDALDAAGLVSAGDDIQIGAVLESDRAAQPGARLARLIRLRLDGWACELVETAANPPTVDQLAETTTLHRGLLCALLNGLEGEGRLTRSKGRGLPRWSVAAPAEVAS